MDKIRRSNPQKALHDMLSEFNIKHEFISHNTTGRTTELAKIALNEEEENILKSLLLKNKEKKYLGVIIGGDKRINFKKVKSETKDADKFNSHDFTFATPGEIKEVLGFEMGGVPPFAFHMNKVKALVDSNLIKKEYVIGAGGTQFTGLKFSPREFEKLNHKFSDITDPIDIKRKVFQDKIPIKKSEERAER